VVCYIIETEERVYYLTHTGQRGYQLDESYCSTTRWKRKRKTTFTMRTHSHQALGTSILSHKKRRELGDEYGVRTHQQSRVQSSPVRLTKTRQWLCDLQWQPQQCLHNSGVESSRVTRVCCRTFHFRQSDSSDRTWRLLSWGSNGCGKACYLVKGHEAIYDASRCEHRNRVLQWWWWCS